MSAFTAAEADYLILSRLGVEAEMAYIDDLVHTYSLPTFDRGDIQRARELCGQYRDLELGLADASIVVLAETRDTRALATFDHRHFRAVTTAAGEPFRLLPGDTDG